MNTTVVSIIWSSWTSTSASGTGTFNKDTCVPDCASGSYTKSQASISLTSPGDYLGYLVFQNITVSPLSGGAPIENMTGEVGGSWGS